MHVLFVCTGNICRSPAAHAVLETRLRREEWATHIRVDSAGTGGWHTGELPDPRARQEGQRRGYRLDHPARPVNREDFQRPGLIIALDKSHLSWLRKSAPPDFPPERLMLLRSFDPQARHPEVADPYYGDASDFSVMFDSIEAAIPGLLQHLRERSP